MYYSTQLPFSVQQLFFICPRAAYWHMLRS